MIISKGNYRLREMEQTDLETVFRWRNSERIRKNMYTDHMISWDEHMGWYENIKNDSLKKYLVFEIDDQSVGLVNFTEIDLLNKKCMWGFYLGETDVPRKSGSVMEYLSLEYIFKKEHIRKLCCEVFNFNSVVIKMHKKFGFEEEAYYKEHILKDNKYEDVIGLALLKDDWCNNRPKIKEILFKR